MSDRTVILQALRSASAALFIEPGAHLVMQDEVHDQARRDRSARGLPDSFPYLGWHTQSDAFDRSGTLVRPQRVYFGGDREAAATALRELEPRGYVIGGGHSDTESFWIYRDAKPTHVDVDMIPQWRIRMEALHNDARLPLRQGEREQLHDVISSPAMWSLLPQAVQALRVREALTEADLDLVLTPAGVDTLGDTAPDVVTYALDIGHRAAGDAAGLLASQGRAHNGILRRWGGPGALAAARAAASAGSDVPGYLALVASHGEDPLAAAVDIATEVKDADEPDTVIGIIVAAIMNLYASPPRGGALIALRDERIPLWLRGFIGDHAIAQWGTAGKDPVGKSVVLGPTPTELAVAVDDVRLWLGQPPSPGFDVKDRAAQTAAIAHRDRMREAHRDGLRAALARRDLHEPEIAVLLELLYRGDALRPQDLAVLAKSWRKRLFVKPGTYTPAAPAVVTYAAALHAVGDAKANEVADVVARDTRTWAVPVQFLLRAALARGRDDDLETESVLAPIAAKGEPHAAIHAVCRVRSRLWQVSPVMAACMSLLEVPAQPPYIRNGFAAAAIAFAEDEGRLSTHYFNTNSPRAFSAAMHIVRSREFPLTARLTVWKVAERSTVLTHPTRPIPLPPEEVERVRGLWREAKAALNREDRPYEAR
ncbi:MAG TPA: hypothetical protein H9902_09655 [Candidatus Stackebrandtia faecavium]|nr:hypothetical protein [Candidatus Stackebrandtia faecavium]